MTTKEMFNQIRALPYILACRHTKIIAPGNCDHAGAKCKCAPKIIRPHAPWVCPDFDEQNWKHFIAHPAVNFIITLAHERLTERGFVRTGEVSARLNKIVIHYDDNLGGQYTAWLRINMPTLFVSIRYYIIMPGEIIKLNRNGNYYSLMHLRTCVRAKQTAMNAEIDTLRAELDTLRKENTELKLQIEYQPNGPGYERARESFARRSAKQNVE